MTPTKSLSNLPDWLVSGVEDYRQKHNLQSWSQAAAVLLAIGLHRATVEGQTDFEKWLTKQVTGTWGGKRR